MCDCNWVEAIARIEQTRHWARSLFVWAQHGVGEQVWVVEPMFCTMTWWTTCLSTGFVFFRAKPVSSPKPVQTLTSSDADSANLNFENRMTRLLVDYSPAKHVCPQTRWTIVKTVVPHVLYSIYNMYICGIYIIYPTGDVEHQQCLVRKCSLV